MNNKDFSYLHIGKTAGTSFRVVVDQNEWFAKHVIYNKHVVKAKDVSSDSKIIFCVRDPVSRFVSAYYHRKSKLIRLETTGFSHLINPLEKEAFSHYGTIDLLLNDLFSNSSKRHNALLHMSNITHIGLFGSYWYWFNGEADLINKVDQIDFVIRTESFEEDLRAFFAKHNQKLDHIPYEKQGSYKKNKAIDNRYLKQLRCFLKNEYQFIEILKQNKLLPDNYLNNEIENSFNCNGAFTRESIKSEKVLIHNLLKKALAFFSRK